MIPKPKRVKYLENLISTLNQEILNSRSLAKAFFEYGKMQASKLSGFFAILLDQTETQVRNIVNTLPVAMSASWTDAAWHDWNAGISQEESLIRIGDFSEERREGSFWFPAFIPFIGHGRTVIIKSSGDPASGAALLQSLVTRTALMLPHQAQYTLLDPAGAGIAFPMRRYLPQVQDNSGDERRDLDQVIVNIQRIIETYLDASITSFELVPPEIRINERFSFIFAADFPNQYDRRAIEALQRVGNTGPAAGTYLFIHYNQKYDLPRDMNLSEFKNALFLDIETPRSYTDLRMVMKCDSAPAAALQTTLFQKLKDAKPPERILDWDSLVGLDEAAWWKANSTKIIETPIGARGGTDNLRLWFGVNYENQPCAHGLLGAMTGSGKSNLYHVFISGLAIRYSPAELRFYLIDGKDGVEFQAYRNLPHAEVVSLRSSPELSRSVLAELVAEKERRNAIFARIGVNDFTSYRNSGSAEGMLPRILLLIDEYQELFEGDKEGIASNHLLQLSQQGRSAGIHMLLASQRFGAAGMLNQTGIFGNLHLLMAMQMKAADVQALTEFGRRGKALIATCDLPGKIVVNDKGGDDTANIAGKVAYLQPKRRNEILQKLQEMAEDLPDDLLPQRVIFNGKAQPNLMDNPYFGQLLRHPAWPTAKELERYARAGAETGGLGIIDWFSAEQPRVIWLGQQFNVRGLAMIIFRRRVAENMLVIGGANAARYGMLSALIASLAVNLSPEHTEFVIFDKSIPSSEWNQVLPATIDSVLTPAGFSSQFSTDTLAIEEVVAKLLAELDRRRESNELDTAQSASVFVLMTELDRIELMRRKADGYGGLADSPLGGQLGRIYVEGPPLGIHLILSFSGVRPMANVIDERRGLHNFRHRVALQMSEDESHTLVRSRMAAQLQLEGAVPICALYIDLENDKATRFKPYSSDAEALEPNESLTEQLRLIGMGLAERNGQA